MNLICPKCKSSNIGTAGKSPSGKQRYRCRICKHSFTGNNPGRPTINTDGTTLTDTQKYKRYKSNVVHYQVPGQEVGYSACGVSGTRNHPEFTNDLDKVTCKSCLKSKIFKIKSE